MLAFLAQIPRCVLTVPAYICFYIFAGLAYVIEWLEGPIDKRRNQKRLQEWEEKLKATEAAANGS